MGNKVDLKTQFPVGAKVRMKAEAVEGCFVAFQRRVAGGRIGIVTGHTFPNENPLVVLPQDGRRQSYNVGAIRASDWEVVELPGAPQ